MLLLFFIYDIEYYQNNQKTYEWPLRRLGELFRCRFTESKIEI